MKDLYRRNKLRPREEDRVKINNCEGSEEDKEAAFTILLNAHKKAEYDRVHATLSTIGYVRRHLGVMGNSNWRVRYGDFLQPMDWNMSPDGKPRKRHHSRLLIALRRIDWRSLVSWPVVIVSFLSLLPLAYLVSCGPN